MTTLRFTAQQLRFYANAVYMASDESDELYKAFMEAAENVDGEEDTVIIEIKTEEG